MIDSWWRHDLSRATERRRWSRAARPFWICVAKRHVANTIDYPRIHETTRLAIWTDQCLRANDLSLRLLYTSLELIRSSRVLAAGNTHNVLSVVAYQSVSSRLKVWPAYACVQPGSVALIKTAAVSNWQTSKTCRSACGAACMWSASLLCRPVCWRVWLLVYVFFYLFNFYAVVGRNKE